MQINAAIVIFGLVCLATLFLDLGTTPKEREERVLKWIVALGPIFAGGALLIAILQLDLNRTTAQRQDRAYVFPDQVGIDLKANSVPKVSLTLKNRGKTAALNTATSNSCRLYDWPVAFGPYRGAAGSSPSRFIIPPDDQTYAFINCGDALSEQNLEELQSGKKALILIGDIVYRDIFDVQHRYIYRRMVGGLAGTMGNSMAHTPVGDESD
jgi:hypothetical protein